jgi:hypothetical protein
MRDPSDTSRVPPEAVGQEPTTAGQNKSGVGGFVRANLFVWGVVIVVAIVFVVAAILAAT